MIQRIEETDSFSIGTTTIEARVATDEKGSAKLFQILTNAYSDKEATTLQEITANAHDSYKRINKEGIVTISYNSADSSLHIIDEAEGISPEVFRKYIVELCASSKEGEIFSAGTLGIGFYTAWCTTETFYITTVHYGVKYYYSCYKEDYKMPIFTPLTQHECNEINGTDYWFYIEKKDKFKFEQALTKLRYFENVFVEGMNFNNNYKIVQANSFMFNNVVPTKDNELEICFGNTPYPINWEKIGISKLHISLALKIDLSEALTILPSREHLKWDEYTINKVKEKIEEFKIEIFELYKKQYEIPFDNILDYYRAVYNKNYIILYEKHFNITDLAFTKAPIIYSKTTEGMKIPDFGSLFEEYSFKYLNKNNKYGNNLFDYNKKDFYLTDGNLTPRRTKLINQRGIAVVKYDSNKLNSTWFSTYDKQSYFTSETLKVGMPDDWYQRISALHANIYADLKDKLLKYDDIVVPKSKSFKVKRNVGIILAKINSDKNKIEYSTEHLNARYIFLTDDKENFDELHKYLNPYISNRKLVLVIFTAKGNFKYFKENVITLEKWVKTDMFFKIYQRACNYDYLSKFNSSYFRRYLKIFKKESYVFLTGMKFNNALIVCENIIRLGESLNIPKNIILLPTIDKEYKFFMTMQNPEYSWYQKIFAVNRMLRNKLNKQSICKQ